MRGTLSRISVLEHYVLGLTLCTARLILVIEINDLL